VDVSGKSYATTPIKLVVDKSGAQNDLSQVLFARVDLPSKQLYIGQTAPVRVLVFARADVPLKGLGGFNYEADGLGFKFLPESEDPARQIVNGESFNVEVIEGAISPSRTGTLNFGSVRAEGPTDRTEAGAQRRAD
jgi:hypothetical protein